MLGLLVGQNGYPIGYNIFEGNTFEGHTLLPVLEGIQKKYGFSKPTVIADAAMLSKKNLDNLSKEKYQFIIGGRIKNETDFGCEAVKPCKFCHQVAHRILRLIDLCIPFFQFYYF
ncbi:transposase [Candidatus Saganbacteria bacterium]|nr:transposase [Candidatus Saganbacteria bacterium]